MPSLVIEPLGEGSGLEAMTFPAYRHLLSLAVGRRHADDQATPIVQPLGVVARVGAERVGLALADVPCEVAARRPASLLSVFVVPPHRRHGVAGRMVDALEHLVYARGLSSMEAIYMTGRDSTQAVERLLASRGWSPPTLRAVTMRATLHELRRMPWYGRVALGPSFEIVAWADVTNVEKHAMAASQRQQAWIPQGLEPWRHERAGFDTTSSLALRHRGAVAGWVINHRISPEIVRFSGAFVRSDLARRGTIFALYTAALERLRQTSCRTITCVTPVRYDRHVAFLRRRCAPWASFFAETRQSVRQLSPQGRDCV
jgi:GNAT superfamily N-acetyltransferase